MTFRISRPRVVLADPDPGRRASICAAFRETFEIIAADGELGLKELLWLEAPDALLVDPAWFGARDRKQLARRLAGVDAAPDLPILVYGAAFAAQGGLGAHVASLGPVDRLLEAPHLAAEVLHRLTRPEAILSPVEPTPVPSHVRWAEEMDANPETVEWLGFLDSA